MAAWPRYRNDQRIVPQGRRLCSPHWQISQCIRPADGEEPLLRGLPAIAAAAHSVVGIAKRDASNAILLCKVDGSLHGRTGVEVAHTAMAVPAFEGSHAN